MATKAKMPRWIDGDKVLGRVGDNSFLVMRGSHYKEMMKMAKTGEFKYITRIDAKVVVKTV